MLRISKIVPDQYKMQEICIKTMKEDLYNLEYIPDKCKTKEMHNEAVEENPYRKEIPDKHMTQEMYNNAVREDPFLL